MSDPRLQAPSARTPETFNVQAKHTYLIGIGGCGMSGLARMLRARGAIVSGSDKEQSEATDALASDGIAVGFDQTKAWLPETCDLVIATAAVPPDHPQVAEATRRGIPIHLYAHALGRSMLGRTGVAVSGTHGKSTTTAMLGCATTDAALDPTVIVGATSSQLTHGCLEGAPIATPPTSLARPTGFRLGGASIPNGQLAGKPGILIAEACEFNRSF